MSFRIQQRAPDRVVRRWAPHRNLDRADDDTHGARVTGRPDRARFDVSTLDSLHGDRDEPVECNPERKG
jgi:hypothetical protein